MIPNTALFFGRMEHAGLANEYAARKFVTLVESAAPSLSLLLKGSFYGVRYLLLSDLDAAQAAKHMGAIATLLMDGVTVVLLGTGREFTGADNGFEFLQFVFESAAEEVSRGKAGTGATQPNHRAAF